MEVPNISLLQGYDGREITRIDNIPRGGEKDRKYHVPSIGVNIGGDDFGNRMDRFFIGVAYLDGIPDDETTGARVANLDLIISRVFINWQVWAL